MSKPTNDELRAAVDLLRQAAMEELPYGYTITLLAANYGINLSVKCHRPGSGNTRLGFYDCWSQAISAAVADAKRRAEQ